MTEIETAVGKDDILKILGWSHGKYATKRRELHRLGVIFYQYEGKPKHKRVRAFPSRLQKYLHAQSLKQFPQHT